MGVIRQFAITSIALGTLALAGGASALAFEGGVDKPPAVQPADQPAVSDVPSDLPSDVPSDAPSAKLPEAGGPSAVLEWLAPHGG